MIDCCGRDINYLRISITDRCNLRCQYCMPAEGFPPIPHEEILTYEELIRVARAALKLGICRFKITGGEPLCRKDCPELIRGLKALPGTEQVTLTTNGLLLPQYLDELIDAGLDCVNISLDTLDNEQYMAITRCKNTADEVLSVIELCAGKMRTKVNAVLLNETSEQLVPLAKLAQRLPVDVRFIETMPIGSGANTAPQRAPALERLQQVWPDLHATGEHRGNGPAVYYGAEGLIGRIGFIEAMSHCFCASCNRLRLTSVGQLKPCLYYAEGTDLRELLRNGSDEAALIEAIKNAIAHKPDRHHFGNTATPEQHAMSQIGG